LKNNLELFIEFQNALRWKLLLDVEYCGVPGTDIVVSLTSLIDSYAERLKQLMLLKMFLA
jgi:hypothetical protein